MRTFVQKQIRPLQPLTSSFSRPSPTTMQDAHEPRNLILRLQRTIGNRTMQRMLTSHAEAPRSKAAAGVNTAAMPDGRLVAADLAQLIERSGECAGSLAKSPATILRQKSRLAKKGDEPKPEKQDGGSRKTDEGAMRE